MWRYETGREDELACCLECGLNTAVLWLLFLFAFVVMWLLGVVRVLGGVFRSVRHGRGGGFGSVFGG